MYYIDFVRAIGPGEVLSRKELKERTGLKESTIAKWSRRAARDGYWSEAWDRSHMGQWQWIYARSETMPTLFNMSEWAGQDRWEEAL